MDPHTNIPPLRRSEFEALRDLLLEHATCRDDDTFALAECIAATAMQDGHLWRSMGLPDRDTLKTIMRDRFTTLYIANSKDMRWKKFLYKHMCGWRGFEG